MIEVIFLDAVGTLFGVRDSVGSAYQKIARQFGVNACNEALNQAFFQSFMNASPMAFPGVEMTQISQCEYDWWKAIAVETFNQVGVLEKFTDFEAFFLALYEYFKTHEPWLVYPEVKSTLEKWQNQGFKLAVLSNFDSRLHEVLKALGLGDFFSSVTISTEVGFAKPDLGIFTAALQKYEVSPQNVLHIGDSFQADYCGAKNAGINAIWLDRDQQKTLKSYSLPSSDYATHLDLLSLS